MTFGSECFAPTRWFALERQTEPLLLAPESLDSVMVPRLRNAVENTKEAYSLIFLPVRYASLAADLLKVLQLKNKSVAWAEVWKARFPDTNLGPVKSEGGRVLPIASFETTSSEKRSTK